MIVLRSPRDSTRIEAITFTSDGRHLVTGSNEGDLQVWVVPAGERVAGYEPEEDIEAILGLVASPDGRWVFVAADSEPRGLRVGTWTVDSLIARPSASADAVAVAADGRFVSAGTIHPQAAGVSQLVCWAPSADGTPTPTWVRPLDGMCQGLAFLPGDRFASLEYTLDLDEVSVITVRNASSGDVLQIIESPNDRAEGLLISPTGSRLVVRAGMTLLVWDVTALDDEPLKVKNTNRKHFTGVAFHPSSRWLAATSNDATVKLYDTATWTASRTYAWDIGRLRSVAFSPDGLLAAAGSDTGRVVVWDVDD